MTRLYVIILVFLMKEPVVIDAEVTNCCCWSADGPIMMKASLAKTGYVHGQGVEQIYPIHPCHILFTINRLFDHMTGQLWISI